jgi:methionyl-tRNA formyltransferase
MSPVRCGLFGTPQVAVATFDALVGAGHDVRVVITRPPRPAGRGGRLRAAPLEARAAAHGVPVAYDPAAALENDLDVGIVVAYGALIARSVLDRLTLWNVHFSLLPRWRGAAPVERAILAGDERTGVSLMQLEEGLDTGPIYGVRELPITARTTAELLRAELSRVGNELLVETLATLDRSGWSGLGPPSPQQGTPIYAAKLDRRDRWLDFSRTAIELDRVVRVGGATTTWRGKRLLVHQASPVEGSQSEELTPGTLVGDLAATGEGWLRLERVQLEGRAVLDFRQFALGARLDRRERLGAVPLRSR